VLDEGDGGARIARQNFGPILLDTPPDLWEAWYISEANQMEHQASQRYSPQVSCPILLIIYQAKIKAGHSDSFDPYHTGEHRSTEPRSPQGKRHLRTEAIA